MAEKLVVSTPHAPAAIGAVIHYRRFQDFYVLGQDCHLLQFHEFERDSIPVST